MLQHLRVTLKKNCEKHAWETWSLHAPSSSHITPMLTITALYNYISFGRNRTFLLITHASSWMQGIPSVRMQSGKKALRTRCHCWERFPLSSLSVILLLKFRYHFTLLHNIKLICKAVHNVTFLSDYSIFYCFLYLIRISLIFSTSSTIPALITVLSFSQMSAHPVVLDTCTHTSDFHHPSSSPTSSKSQ